MSDEAKTQGEVILGDPNEWPISEVKDWHPGSASIIIDNFNYAAYLGGAVESALAQTHSSQVIVVDDGSSDDSRKIIASFGERIEAVFKENGGQASAFNAGFAKAAGDVIFFLDSDDLMEPNAVSTVLSAWRAGTVLAHYPMTMIDSSGNPRGVVPGPHAALLAEGDVREILIANGSFPATITSGMAFARPALARIMPMPEKDFVYSADGYLVRAMPFLGSVQRVDALLARYRMHGGNGTNPWSDPAGYVTGFRKKMACKENEFEATKKFAAMFHFPVSSSLGERDADYLSYRLYSLALDPANHPIANDRRIRLLMRYAACRWRSPWSLRRRLKTIVLPALAVFSRPSAAAALIRWMSDSSARPNWVNGFSGWLRQRQQGKPGLPGPASGKRL